jgi:hypothetical protein
MRGRVTHDPGQILFNIPANVISQPIHLRRQLHISLNANGRLVAPNRCLRQHKRRNFSESQDQISGRVLHGAVQ